MEGSNFMVADPGPRPSGSRALAAEARRRDILAAGVKCFDEMGFIGATAEEIAAASGVTKRTLYRYIGSKHRLLREIHESFISEGLERWTRVVDRGGDPLTVLRALILEHVRIVAEHQESIRVFFEDMKYLDDEDYQYVLRRREEYASILRETLEAAMAAGYLKERPVRVTSMLVLGALTELWHWYRPAGELSPEDLASFIADALVDGLASTDGTD